MRHNQTINVWCPIWCLARWYMKLRRIQNINEMEEEERKKTRKKKKTLDKQPEIGQIQY